MILSGAGPCEADTPLEPASPFHGPAPGGDAPDAVAGFSLAELEVRYQAYRRRQARSLVGMLPREAVRPLYRRALRDSEGPSDGDDPMGLLLASCEELLPLPPFDVWLDDLRARPDAHWRDMEGSAEAPTATAPATIDVRDFARGASRWMARLRGFRDHDTWRGFIAFEEEHRSGPVYRTTLVFRESGPSELRDRFRGFDSGSLEAFLRSALP